VQQAATALKFGCHRDAASFLRCFGWEDGEPRVRQAACGCDRRQELPPHSSSFKLPAVEEFTPFDLELMYDVLTVGLEYRPDLHRAVRQRHKQEPVTSVAVGRLRF
jgi:hypothetical protein